MADRSRAKRVVAWVLLVSFNAGFAGVYFWTLANPRNYYVGIRNPYNVALVSTLLGLFFVSALFADEWFLKHDRHALIGMIFSILSLVGLFVAATLRSLNS